MFGDELPLRDGWKELSDIDGLLYLALQENFGTVLNFLKCSFDTLEEAAGLIKLVWGHGGVLQQLKVLVKN